MDPQYQLHNKTPMLSAKLTQSFIQETPNRSKDGKSQDQISSKPSTFLSLLIPDSDNKKGQRSSSKNLHKSSTNLLKQALMSNYSQSNIKPTNQMQISQLLAMTDQQMKNKYQNDGFFKTKLDLKIKKIQASHIVKHNHRKQRTGDSDQDQDQSERKQSNKMLTLNHFKHKQDQNLLKLHEKYIRIFPSKLSNTNTKSKQNSK